MNTKQRLELAFKTLQGISIGDAFGDSFFGEQDKILHHIHQKTIPDTQWEFTDDTVMTIAIFKQLEKYGCIDQDDLAIQFAKNHQLDVNRGYGATARRILREIEQGRYWKDISYEVFEGMGSMGNGASMRVAPIGAYYFDNLKEVKIQAEKSAEITHSNIEGISGAIATAIATALATDIKVNQKRITPAAFLKTILEYTPDSDTKSKIEKGLTVPYHYSIETVKSILGNGSQISAKDTVPFSLWCAAYNLNNFEEALWKAVSILGDRDTICAIVGGITFMSTEQKYIPNTWLSKVEKFETSIFYNSSN